jgi:hypothetical protein
MVSQSAASDLSGPFRSEGYYRPTRASWNTTAWTPLRAAEYLVWLFQRPKKQSGSGKEITSPCKDCLGGMVHLHITIASSRQRPAVAGANLELLAKPWQLKFESTCRRDWRKLLRLHGFAIARIGWLAINHSNPRYKIQTKYCTASVYK